MKILLYVFVIFMLIILSFFLLTDSIDREIKKNQKEHIVKFINSDQADEG